MSKQKVTFWIEEREIELLKEKIDTDNQAEAVRLAIMQSLAMQDLKVDKLKSDLEISLMTTVPKSDSYTMDKPE